MTNKLEVILAGFNVDIDTLKNPDLPQTPETISAAYARISRADKSATELRAEALRDVAKARASNRQIIHDYGHGSVAEHAVFNLDILGISRLALEDVEHFRFASFTEKSQRYIKGAESMIPSELKPRHAERLQELDHKGHDIYNRMIDAKIEPQDARFVYLLSTVGQVGVTVNARELEYMMKCLRHSPLEEVRNLSDKLHEQVEHIAPSLFKMYPNEFFRTFPKRAEEAIYSAMRNAYQYPPVDFRFLKGERSHLVYDANPELNMVANLIFSHIHRDLESSYHMAHNILGHNQGDKAWRMFKELLQDMGEHDAAPREFETGPFNFQFTNSSSSFAQLKRHRTATLLKQPYDLSLGYTTPQGIIDAGFQEEYDKYMEEATSFVRELQREYGQEIAEYGLTNAHRRLSLFITNARGLYNFSRERENEAAQWEIRADAHDAMSLVKQVCPLPFMLACGKSEFEDMRNKLYNQNE